MLLCDTLREFLAVFIVEKVVRCVFILSCYVTIQEEAVIHFEDDIEELQQWDQQISGLCQALNDILDGMAKKGLPVPV